MNHNISPQGTQAPSEKHLEDWLWKNAAEFSAQLGTPPQYYIEFWDRQVVAPSGVIDLIGADAYRTEFFVVELKRGDLDARAFAQLLRYMRDISSVFYGVWADLVADPATNHTARCVPAPLEDLFSGVLIGHSIKDENLLVACEAAGVTVYTYQYRDGSYQFSRVSSRDVKRNDNLIASLQQAFVGSLAREVMIKHGTYQKHLRRNFDAAAVAEEYLNGGVA